MRRFTIYLLFVLISGIANAKDENSLPEWMVGEWTIKGIFIEMGSIDMISPDYIPYKYDKDTTFIAERHKFRLAERGCSRFSVKQSSVYMKNYLKKPLRETNIFIDAEVVELSKNIKNSKTIEARIICTENLTGRKSDPELTVSSAITFPLDWEFVKLGDDIGIKDYPCADCFFIFQRAPSEKTS